MLKASPQLRQQPAAYRIWHGANVARHGAMRKADVAAVGRLPQRDHIAYIAL